MLKKYLERKRENGDQIKIRNSILAHNFNKAKSFKSLFQLIDEYIYIVLK